MEYRLLPTLAAMDYRQWSGLQDWRRETRGAPSGTTDLFFNANQLFPADTAALLDFNRPAPQGDLGPAPPAPRFNDTSVTLRDSPASEHGRRPWADCTNQLKIQIQSVEAQVESHSELIDRLQAQVELIDRLQAQVQDLENRLNDALKT